MQQSSRMLAGARQRVGAVVVVGFEDGAIGQGGAAGGGADAAGPAQCAGRKRARRGAVVQQQRAVGLRRQRGGTMAAAPAGTAGPQRATLRTGGVAKAFKLAEFAAEASGRLVLARYQFVQPGRGQQGQALRQIPVAAHARPGIGQRQGENGGQHAGNHQPQVHRWRESALQAMAAGQGQVAEDFLAQAGAVHAGGVQASVDAQRQRCDAQAQCGRVGQGLPARAVSADALPVARQRFQRNSMPPRAA